MRATVLRDERLARRAGQFVWLSIDTEKARNAAFVERFQVEVWPTFLVIDPREERPIVRWPGSASVEQMMLLLDAGRRGTVAGHTVTSAAKEDEALLARADAANADGRFDEAILLYRRALAVAPRGWSRRGAVVESLLGAEQSARQLEACAATARQEAPRLPRDRSFANVAAAGLSCAIEAPADAAWRARALDALEPLVREAVQLPRLLADDRSGFHEQLTAAREARGDAAGARRAAERWWSFLERERRRAGSAEERAALDSARVAAAQSLGDPARALPQLRASERELPNDYNPPARIAYLLREMGRLADARAAAERALQKAYGPRKLKVYDLAASILERQGDRAGLAEHLEAALAYAETLPASQRDPRTTAALSARRARLDTDSR